MPHTLTSHPKLYPKGLQRVNHRLKSAPLRSKCSSCLAIVLTAFTVAAGQAQIQPLKISSVQTVPGNTNNPGNDMVVVGWTGGSGPFQLQSTLGYNTPWQDVACITSGSCQTNIQINSGVFYRVADVGGI